MNVTNIYIKNHNHSNFSTNALYRRFPGSPSLAQWMRFSGSSCTCLSPLCRCSPGRTWHSLGGSRSSSLRESEDEQISFASTLPSYHFRSRHLEEVGKKKKKNQPQTYIYSHKKTWDRKLWDVRGRKDLRGHAEFTRGSERGRSLPEADGQWQIRNQNPDA